MLLKTLYYSVLAVELEQKYALEYIRIQITKILKNTFT